MSEVEQQILSQLKALTSEVAALRERVAPAPAQGTLETAQAISYMGWSGDPGKRLLTWLRTKGHIKLSAKTRPMRYEVRELDRIKQAIAKGYVILPKIKDGKSKTTAACTRP